MSEAVLTLELPEEIYERVRRAAKGMKQPVEKALVRIVRAATPSLDKVPRKYRAELEAMEALGDDELWGITKSQLSPDEQGRLTNLLEKNDCSRLNARDRRTLNELGTAADRLMLRRSYAYLLLKYRGHRIPNVADLRK
jgi:hypothetical protein